MAEEQRLESFYNNLNVKCEVICSIDIARILITKEDSWASDIY